MLTAARLLRDLHPITHDYESGCTNKWIIGSAADKDARKDGGWMCTVTAVADGMLPHEAMCGWWLRGGAGGRGRHHQASVLVRGMSTRAADRPVPSEIEERLMHVAERDLRSDGSPCSSCDR